MANDIIDINVSETVDSVSITVNPNLTTVNINQVTGGLNQTLQSVTDLGSTTSNSITANSFIKSGGTGANVLLDNGTTTVLANLGTKNDINSKQLQLNYLDRDNSIFDAFYLRTIADGGIVEASNQLLSSLAVLRNISYINEGYTQQLNADKFVKLGGAADEYLMADGSISYGGGGGGGATNLTTTQTISNFTINSNTGTDATVPLGNGTLAGATLNDYTTTEKNKLAGIAIGAEVNVNADWNAVSGDAQILNKPTIPSGNLSNAIASGTDTYTATIAGVTSYVDGAGYLIRFTNGNTQICSININGLGARTLYRNNDGQLIGGDIQDLGEMLLVYSSALSAFKCIGTSPNDIIAYVTNAESITITKGQPVYAFGGVGDRMTVKLAYNTLDSTSAQTVGLVMSTSIAANQKGYIITQGLLDNLSTLSSPFIDGDTVYLGATAGTITRVKPSAPNHLVYLGVVTTASAGAAGRMYVKPQNGYELNELHDVALTSPPANNNGLFYESSTDLWKNKSITTALGYTPANDSGVVHIAGTETMTGIKTIAPVTQDEDVTGIIRTVLTVTNSDTNATEDIAGGIAINAFSNGTAIYASSPFGYAINAFSEGTAIHANSIEQTAILAESEGIGIVSNCTLGKPIVTYGNGAATPSIENNLGNTNKGLVVNSGASSSGNVIEHNKNSTINFSVNQAGEVTAAKFIKQSGTAAQLLVADGSVITAGTNITISGGTISSSGGSSAQGAYTILANNTSASALPTEQVFKNIAEQVYTLTPVWTATTAPSGTTNHTYQWSQISKIVTVRLNLIYTTLGAGATIVTCPFPTDLPIPLSPSGLTSATANLYYGTGLMTNTNSSQPTTLPTFTSIRRNAANTGYELTMSRASNAPAFVYITIQYFTT